MRRVRGGDLCGLRLRRLQVTDLKGLLAGRIGRHHCQGEIRRQVRPIPDNADLDRVGAAGDELLSAGNTTSVLARPAVRALVPGRP